MVSAYNISIINNTAKQFHYTISTTLTTTPRPVAHGDSKRFGSKVEETNIKYKFNTSNIIIYQSPSKFKQSDSSCQHFNKLEISTHISSTSTAINMITTSETVEKV